MTEPLTRTTARVEDLPRWLAQLERMGVQALLDEPCPTHGHGVGRSVGWVSVIWLPPLRSEGDHRLHHGTPWATPRLPRRRACTGPPVHPWDVGDDRRATVLEALRHDTPWSAGAGALQQPARRVDALEPAGVRLERTTANGPWTVTADGLWPVGHRQAHRPDRPPVKRMVSALEPLGLPVATDVGPGQRADDPWSVPALTRVRAGLGRRGLLSVGEGQMGALATRALLQAGGDDDVGPWSEVQRPPAVWAGDLAPVWTGEPALRVMHRAPPGGPPAQMAAGVARLAPVSAAVAGPPHRWRARRLVIRSGQLAPAGERGLRGRLATAQAAVTARHARRRGRRRCADPSALREAVEAIRARDRGPGLRQVRAKAPRWEPPWRRDGGRDAAGRRAWDLPVRVRLDQAARAAAVRPWGWRVSVTTPPRAQRSRPEAVLASRHASLVERAMGRRQGRPWSLTPRSRARDDHATGLSRLWSLGLRVLTRLELGGRRRLAIAKTTRAGVSVGNPNRATPRPTAARLLEALQGLTLTILRAGRRWRRHLTPLSRLHQRMLARLDFPVDIYPRLWPDARKPP